MLLKRGSGSGERKSAVADPGEGPGGPAPRPPPHLFLDQTEARRTEKEISSFSTRRKEHSNFLGPHFQQLHSQ